MRNRSNSNRPLRRGFLALTASLSLLGAAHAGPENETIVRGDVTFIRNGDHTIIQASDGSIINYISFDILPWETVQFIQPSHLSRVLNRITGPDPTVIQGTLLSNGQVYIVNPAGVYFTGSSVVNVGGLYAAAGDMSNYRFINGVNRFSNLSGNVVNEGAMNGGEIHLIGRNVANHGSIQSTRGVVTMLAGDDVLIRRHGERITIKVDGKVLNNRARPHAGGTAPDMTATAGVVNTGTIEAAQGKVFLGSGDLYGLAIHNTGTVHAGKGHITVAATDGLIVNDGTISAAAANGWSGNVVVQGPSVVNRGTITADANGGRAGSVQVTSQNHTYLTEGSRISAAGNDGTASGGKVLVHSYDGITVFGTGAEIDVSGGETGGRGGYAEISGKDLTFNGFADASATTNANAGTIFIDPFNIIINEEGGDDSFLGDGIITFFEGGDDDAFIAASTLSNIFGLIHLQAQGSIFVDAPVDLDLNNDLLFEAANVITVREPITGANSLRFFADVDLDGFGYVSINVPLDVTENIIFSGDHIRLNGGSITTGTTQEYRAPVWLGSDNILTGTDITFDSTVDSKFDVPDRALAINGNVTFFDNVGQTDALRSLDIDGDTTSYASLIRTRLDQDYRGDVRLGTTLTARSLESGDITFHSTVDSLFSEPPAQGDGGGVSLFVETDGTTGFLGEVGASGSMEIVSTDNGGTTNLGADVTANVVRIGDSAELSDDVELTGYSSVTVNDVAGNGFDLRLNGDEKHLNGDISGVDHLSTDFFGTTFIEGSEIFANSIVFGTDVELENDTHISGANFLNFAGDINGNHDLRVSTDHHIGFGGNIGNDTALASLRIDAGGPDTIDENLVFFYGDSVTVNGDILLNADGRNVPATVATFVGAENLFMQSLNGDIVMGQGEKFTVFGDLDLRALNGTAQLSDITTGGDLDVRAGTIEIVTRPGGDIILPDGSLGQDGGVDFIAGGSIFFNQAPIVLGDGLAPVFGAGNGVNALLGGFEVQSVSIDENDLYLLGGKEGVVLDLSLERTIVEEENGGGEPAPTPDAVEGDLLVNTLDDDQPEIEPRVYRDAVALTASERLALFLRGLTDEELVARTGGVEIVVDADRSGGQPTVAGTRVNRQRLVACIDRYSSIFLVRRESGELTDDDQAPRIREQLADAWAAYQASSEASMMTFRAWAATQEAHTDAVVYLDGIRDLFAEMRSIGVTPAELQASYDAILDPITPNAMSRDELDQLVFTGTVS